MQTDLSGTVLWERGDVFKGRPNPSTSCFGSDIPFLLLFAAAAAAPRPRCYTRKRSFAPSLTHRRRTHIQTAYTHHCFSSSRFCCCFFFFFLPLFLSAKPSSFCCCRPAGKEGPVDQVWKGGRSIKRREEGRSRSGIQTFRLLSHARTKHIHAH